MRRILAVSVLALACSEKTPPPTPSIDDFLPYVPLTQHVDPFIGSEGSGNVIPGALLPHGMVKLSPDTNGPAGTIDAYEWGDDKIEGFSHTHLEGPGGSNMGYSQLLVTATRGAIATDEAGYASTYDHARESAEPGFYTVDLLDAAAKAELTATAHCGVHRYTFEGASAGNVLVDAAHSRGKFLDSEIRIAGRAVEGTGEWDIHPIISLTINNISPDWDTARRTIHFFGEIDRDPSASGTWSNGVVTPGAADATIGRVGAYWTFADVARPVELRFCISSIDVATAKGHFEREVRGRTFEEVRGAAREAWNKLLNRIQVEGGSDDARELFYTALYRLYFAPTDYSENGRFWSGSSGEGKVNDATFRYFSDDWCMWDTYRTSHPLQVLVEPELRADVVRSLLHDYKESGWLPKCTWQATGHSRVMIGNHFTPVIVDSYLKGIRGFDPNLAWEAMHKSATEEDPDSLVPALCGYFNLGTPPEYVSNGFVGDECDPTQAASMTLEYAYDDWVLAQYADVLGKPAQRDVLLARAGNWRNQWNPEKNFMQRRYRDGTWVEPFDPARFGSSSGFCEASSWIYTFFVPHDVKGLIGAVGGNEAFVAKLNAYYEGGFDDLSNEPAFGTPYLYTYAGRPDLTQARLRALVERHFHTGSSGLPGNDDAGAMSSWLVFAMLGLYPVTPGDGTYVIGSPHFEKATIYLEPNHYAGRTFTVVAKNASEQNPYVQSAKLNGAEWTKPWITHADVARGGTLELQMGSAPSTWGSRPEDAPPSMTK